LSSLATQNCEHTELGIRSNSDLVVCREGYAIGYSFKEKSAEWVAYKLRKQVGRGVDRTNDFRADPEVPSKFQTTPEDYAEPIYNQGHLASSESIDTSYKVMSETFYMSNIVPQLPIHNTGIWKGLENRERKWANKDDLVYIVTGPLYEGFIDTIGKNKVQVPSHFWKVIYDPRNQRVIAYLIDHKPLYTKDLDNYLVSVDEIEKRTGIDFFYKLDNEIENKIERKAQSEQW